MMMGRLGPHALAAGSLGSNLYFMPLIFGLGLMIATSPMIATELGRKRHSVRDVRRTVRQGLWLAVMVSIPIWLFLWHAEADPDCDGPGAAAGGAGRRLCALAAMGGAALLWLYRAALLHLGAGAAAAGRWSSSFRRRASMPSPTGA